MKRIGVAAVIARARHTPPANPGARPTARPIARARRPSRAPSAAPQPSAPAADPSRFPAEIALRFLREIGTRAVLRVYWDGVCGDPSYGYHDAKIHLADSGVVEDFTLGGDPIDHPIECWPTKCDRCGADRPPIADLPDHARQVFHTRLYEAPDGVIVEERHMAAGDCFYSTWLHDEKTGACHYWDDCAVPHLHVVIPCDRGGQDHLHSWDLMSRANNCSKKEDRRHRCWIAHGDPAKGELVTVGKAGTTCAAGAGSILCGDYHAMLSNSVLRRC